MAYNRFIEDGKGFGMISPGKEATKEKKRALVTGGAGFIGSHTVDLLLRKGWEVEVLDDFSGASRDTLEPHFGRADFSLTEGSIEDQAILRDAVRGADVVFHFAAFVSVPLSVEKPEECFRVNVEAFEKLLLELRETKTPLLYASSAAVYGDRSEGPRHEDEPPRPLSPYGASKAINELQALAAWNTWGVPSVGFRFFNVYGERQRVGGAYASVVPKFCEKLLRGESPLIFGDGGQTRDFIYVADIAATMLAFVPLVGDNRGEVFNVASGKSISVREVLSRLEAISGVKAQEVSLPARADDIRHSSADLRKITSVVAGYSTTAIDDGLKKTFEWYRKNLR